jgi:hypothetical protein
MYFAKMEHVTFTSETAILLSDNAITFQGLFFTYISGSFLNIYAEVTTDRG